MPTQACSTRLWITVRDKDGNVLVDKDAYEDPSKQNSVPLNQIAIERFTYSVTLPR